MQGQCPGSHLLQEVSEAAGALSNKNEFGICVFCQEKHLSAGNGPLFSLNINAGWINLQNFGGLGQKSLFRAEQKRQLCGNLRRLCFFKKNHTICWQTSLPQGPPPRRYSPSSAKEKYLQELRPASSSPLCYVIYSLPWLCDSLMGMEEEKTAREYKY